MPLYEYACARSHRFIRFLSLADHQSSVPCKCGQLAHQVITAPLYVKSSTEVRYTSPVDGTPITSRHAWQEDMKRNNCVPYDPEMKTDYHRRQAESDASLDRMIDAHVEETIEKMPTAKRAKLHSELIDQGVTAEVTHL